MNWRGDGALVLSADYPILVNYIRTLRRRGIPVVDLSLSKVSLGGYHCVFDQRRISELVAAHFREYGFEHVAFFSMESIPTRMLEYREMQRAWKSRGGGVESWIWPGAVYEKSVGNSDAMQKWLRKRLLDTPKPIGVVCPNSYNASVFLSVCKGLGLLVPEEVSVISEWYEPAFCENQPISISGVVCDTSRRLLEATALLNRIVSGDRHAPREILIPPTRLHLQQSSDAFATRNPVLRRALSLIREGLSRPIGVSDIAARLGVARVTLDRLFAAELNRSVGTEILRMRILRAKRLLAETDEKLSAIAAECGFCHASYLIKAFKTSVGETPRVYRKRCRAEG